VLTVKRNAELFKKIALYVWEAGKWIVVIWLLWPLQHTLSGKMDFSRIVLGILLFVIFAGKLFYDSIMRGYHSDEGKGWKDLLAILGMVGAMVLLIAAVVAIFGILLFNSMQSNLQPGGNE
jgi:hypothetical protein